MAKNKKTATQVSEEKIAQTTPQQFPSYRNVTNALQGLFDAHLENAVLNGVFENFGVTNPQDITANNYQEVIDQCALLKKADNKTLLGSSNQPATFDIVTGETLSLDDIVRKAYESAGISSPAHWNILDEEEREALIAAQVSLLKTKKN